MAHIQCIDELVREYLLFRGFNSTVKAFDSDLKADKDKGFRVDKIIEQIVHFINVSDLNGLKEYWQHLDSLVFSKLEIHVQPAVRKLEYSLYKLYLVTASQSTGGVKNEKVAEFLSKMLTELQGQNEWRDWFMLPYIQKPEENPTFSLYYTRAWQDSVLVSLHNLLATVFQCMPQPTLTSYESDAALVKRLQDELASIKIKMLNESAQKPAKAPSYALPHYKDYNLMKPVAPEYLELLHASTEKGSTEKYLKARNKIAPEDKYNSRATTNFDYGWQQRQARVPARDVNHGRCAILRDTFYRKSNLGPDPRHYSQPSGGQITVCSEYSCNF